MKKLLARFLIVCLVCLQYNQAQAVIVSPLPNNIQNGQPADASKVMANFNQIVNNVNSNAANLAATNTFTQPQIVPPATAGNHVPTANQVQADMGYVQDAGSLNAYAASTVPTFAAYSDGLPITFKAATTNSIATPTLNINSISSIPIYYPGGTSLPASAILTNGIYTVRYSSTGPRWELDTGSVISAISASSATFSTTASTVSVSLNTGVVGVTPSAGDNTTKVPTTSYVRSALGALSGLTTVTSSVILTNAMLGNHIQYSGPVGGVITLPTIGSVPATEEGYWLTNPSANPVTISGGGTNIIYGNTTVGSFLLASGDTIFVHNQGSTQWCIFSPNNAIGFSQTWQDVTASRALSTTYTNSTGKPIMVEITNGTSAAVTVTVAGVTIISGTVGGSAYSFIVPPGASYSAAGGTIAHWAELR